MTQYTINEKFRAAPAAAEGARPPSEKMIKVAEMFGIGLDESYEVALYEDFRIDIRPADVVFITGTSGSGKSVLLRRIEEALRAEPAARVVNLADVERLPRSPVIELMAGPLEESLRLLSAAGRADAFLLLRTPDELSDGQRYRLRLAKALEECGVSERRTQDAGVGTLERGTRNAERGTQDKETDEDKGTPSGAVVAGVPSSAFRVPSFSVLVADEFCSTLDRLCARAVAYRVRRLADRYGLTVLAAAANDDLVEDLAPDVLVIKHEASRAEVHYADPARVAGER